MPSWLPPHLIALPLHLPDELGFGFRLPHTQVDGVHQLELPALAPHRRAVFAGAYLLFPRVPPGRLQHLQSVGHADLVVDLPLPLEIYGVLVELAAILPAYAVDDQVVVEVAGVCVGGDHHLELWEQLLGQLQPYGVDLLWRHIL